ncbi:MAG: hypothetical protein U0931_21155 [Vulcanimicrobiota bacterium]
MFVSNTVPVYNNSPMVWIPSMVSAQPAPQVAPVVAQALVVDSQIMMLQIADQLASMLAQLMNPAPNEAVTQPETSAAVSAVAPQTRTAPEARNATGHSAGVHVLEQLGEWGPQDERMLDKAIQGVANGHGSESDKADFDAIFSQFGQNKIGNCVSTGVIKAALDHFDGEVFDHVTKDSDGYKVALRNGSSVHISRDELRQAGHATNWDGKPSEVKSMATLCYAVIAKREARRAHISLADAFNDMADGYSATTAVKYLGLASHVKQIKASEINQYDGIFAHGGHHVVYVDQNKTDHYGRAQKFNNTNTNGDKLDGLWAFVG